MLSQQEVKTEVRVLNLGKSDVRQLPHAYIETQEDVLAVKPVCWIDGKVLGDHEGYRWIVAQMADSLVLIPTMGMSTNICTRRGGHVIWNGVEVKHAIVR